MQIKDKDRGVRTLVHLYTPIRLNIHQMEDVTITEKIDCTGKNTGNIVWFESVRRSIKYDSIGRNIPMDRDIKNIVIPMANHIQPPDHTLAGLYNRLKPYLGKCRLTMIGLGAQLKGELNTPKKLVASLTPQFKNILKELSLYTKSIGIRGGVTAECLELMGIRNYQIIGCPSFYIGSNIVLNTEKLTDKFCVSWGSSDYSREQFVREFFRKNAKQGDALLLQTMSDFPRTLFENACLEERHIRSCYPDIDVVPQDIEDYIRSRGHIFFDWDEWQEFLKREQFTMSVGCRFHGNMMSYLSGIPALWIVHDSRTYELCEALVLPYVTLEQAANFKKRSEFAEFCVYNDRFYKNRDRMNQLYSDFLRENGIEQI